jgi:hypothetical protein
MTMLWRVDDHSVTMSCIPIEAQEFLASHEWEMVPPEDAKRITEANPPAPKYGPVEMEEV